MFDAQYFSGLGLGDIYNKVCSNERLSQEDGERLFACQDILAVGALAHHRRMDLHGLKTYYVRNRHINYSNVCVTRCRFCAFRREEGQKGSFTLTKEEIIARALDDGGSPFEEIHIVGGCHPTLSLDWFEDIFATLHRERPDAILKAFTVTEIAHFASMHGISIREVLTRLKASGLRMLTGGGAEIFEPSIRMQICPEKLTGEEYLEIAGIAHELGLYSNCSMLFGHIESPADRVNHLCALREQQDKTGGFMCFIPLPFQTKNNPLADGLPQKGRSPDVDSGLDNLRTIAISRLMLDNIPHIKAYWVMLGVKLAQAALSFGANDLDGTIEEEHIGHMAGADSSQSLTRAQLEDMILGCGFIPVNRNALFTQTATEHTPPSGASPDCSDANCSSLGAAVEDNSGQGQNVYPDSEKTEIIPVLNATAAFRTRNRLGLSSDPLLFPNASEAAPLVQKMYTVLEDLHTVSEEIGKYAEEGIFPLDSASIARKKSEKDLRLSRKEALQLYRQTDLFTLGQLAHETRMVLHPEPVVTYVADRNINYSNICSCACRFCAFFRPPGHPEGFIINKDDLHAKIRETIELGGTQILMQGGHHPDLPLEFYEDMLSWIRRNFPNIHIHAFSPPEIVFFCRK